MLTFLPLVTFFKVPITTCLPFTALFHPVPYAYRGLFLCSPKNSFYAHSLPDVYSSESCGTVLKRCFIMYFLWMCGDLYVFGVWCMLCHYIQATWLSSPFPFLCHVHDLCDAQLFRMSDTGVLLVCDESIVSVCCRQPGCHVHWVPAGQCWWCSDLEGTKKEW